ncbi:MAG: GNAT family N-acetyltransferase [Deltaproteobacteria bacterium]|nr:GNAT family N-acetyltransferase [Deltaproteobacteria bacterium]
MGTGTVIRSARPSDAPFMGWLILTAGRAHVKRGIWEVLLDAPEGQCLVFLAALAVTKKVHLFHHSCYLLAQTDGHPVAGLGGYDPTLLGYPALRDVLPDVFRKTGLTPHGEISETGSPRIVSCVPPALEGAWVIDSVATLPDYRRKGIVSRLLEEILTRGRHKGFRLAQINIYIGNEPARRAYEKHGFQILDETRDPYFEAEIGSPGMARLVRDI